MVKAVSVLMALLLLAPSAPKRTFCEELVWVVRSGHDNDFDAVESFTTMSKGLLPLPQVGFQLSGFTNTTVDNSKRFIAQILPGMDSARAAYVLDSMTTKVAACLPPPQWDWQPYEKDDSTTKFFKEVRYYNAEKDGMEVEMALIKFDKTRFGIHLYVVKKKP
jgi:hypothetical protein